MTQLVFQGKNEKDLNEELEALSDLVEESSTTQDLLDIEEQIGVAELLGAEDWEMIPHVLSKLQSPFEKIYEKLVDKWEELDN